MAEKRKVKRRKDEDFDFDNKDAKKPTKEEETIAKWMKKNVAVKKTKFAGHNVEYFTGSKAVDALMESDWCRKKVDKEPFFATRQDVVNFLNNMLRHKLFHRAKKVPVSEQELKKKMKKKDKKVSEKEDKKKKEDETAESSHAEGKEAEDKKQNADERQKKCKKIKLEMHYEQMFVDNLDAYVWLYDPTPFYYWIIGFLVVIGAIAICLFPLWPPTVRMGVQYLSMAAAGLLILILALAVIRLIVFCLVWLLTCGTLHLWLLPNLTEDVGFFASFWPLYEYKYGKQKEGGKNKKNKKKKAKYSDNEEEAENENNAKGSEVKDAANDEKNTVDNDSDNGSRSEGEANEETEYLRPDEEGTEQVSEEDEDYDRDGESDEEDEESNESEDSESYNHTDQAARNPSKSKQQKERAIKNKSSSGERISRHDSEETDTESSSQHSLTGKDFEFVDREDSDMKS